MRIYAPPAPVDAPVAYPYTDVCCVGDSNTSGLGTFTGYRGALYTELATTRGLSARLIGTLTTQGAYMPFGAGTGHEGVAGETIAQIGARMAGTWGGGGGVVLGSADDPGVGLRGHLESTLKLAAGPNTQPSNFGLIVHAGTNDGTTGTIPTAAYQTWIQRMWAVGNARPGALRWIMCCSLIPRTDGHQSNNDAFNAALPSIVGTLRAAGVCAIYCDLATGFDTAWINNSLGAAGLHMDDAHGAPFCAGRMASALRAAGMVTA